MTRLISMTLVLLMGALVALGWATERPEIFSPTEPAAEVLVFADGTQLWRSDEVQVENLSEGVKVKLAYEEANGHHVVTSVESGD